MSAVSFCLVGVLFILAGLFILGVFQSASKGKYVGDKWRNNK